MKILLCVLPPAAQGMLLAKDIRDRERGGRAEIRVVEGEDESGSPQIMSFLNNALGERTCDLTDGPPDESADQEQKAQLTLYQCVAHMSTVDATRLFFSLKCSAASQKEYVPAVFHFALFYCNPVSVCLMLTAR